LASNEPKLVFVQFLDHAQHFDLSAPGTYPDDLEKIPIATNSLCGWILKETKEAIWLYSMKTEYPVELSRQFELRSEGYHAYWCILKKNIVRLEEIELKKE